MDFCRFADGKGLKDHYKAPTPILFKTSKKAPLKEEIGRVSSTSASVKILLELALGCQAPVGCCSRAHKLFTMSRDGRDGG